MRTRRRRRRRRRRRTRTRTRTRRKRRRRNRRRRRRRRRRKLFNVGRVLLLRNPNSPARLPRVCPPCAQWRHVAGSSAMVCSARRQRDSSAGSGQRHVGHVCARPFPLACARSWARQESPPVSWQGLYTLVHFSAQPERRVWGRGCAWGLCSPCSGGVRGCLWCVGCLLMSDTAHVELRSGQVKAPVSAQRRWPFVHCSTRPSGTSRHRMHFRPSGTSSPSSLMLVGWLLRLDKPGRF